MEASAAIPVICPKNPESSNNTSFTGIDLIREVSPG
jgi:hypothetical protein